MDMNSLSQELIDAIAGYLPRGRERAHCACLSIKWRRAIEQLTFSILAIDYNDHPDEEFFKTLDAYLTPQRFGYVRELHMTIEVIVENIVSEWYYSEEIVRKQVIEKLRKPFEILAARNSVLKDGLGASHGRAGISFHLSASTNYIYWPWDPNPERKPELADLGDYKSLPILEFITRLTVSDRACILPLGTGFELSTQLPSLADIELDTCQRPRFWSFGWLHIRDRHSLAKAMANKKLMPKLHDGQFTLSMRGPDDADITPSLSIQVPNSHVNPTAPSFDPLCVAIRTFSQNLTSLSLATVLDASIFWPREAEADANKGSTSRPHWPHLKHLTVRMGVSKSNGTHYFERPFPPSKGDPDVVPHKKSMQELFSSWAQALSQMPVLESATLWFRIHRIVYLQPPHLTPQSIPKDPIRWIVGFHAPGVIADPKVHSCHIPKEQLKRPRLTFERTHGWRPEMTTMEALRDMAKNRFPDKELAVIDNDSPDKS